MGGVEHSAHNIVLRRQGDSMSGSIRVADAQRPGLKAKVAYGFVCIANQRIGDTTCQQVRKQPKAHIDAIILLVDQANVETGRIPLTNRHECLFAVALLDKGAYKIVAGAVRDNRERDVEQPPMSRQGLDNNVNGSVSPYGNHAVAVVAMTCKIYNITARPWSIGL